MDVWVLKAVNEIIRRSLLVLVDGCLCVASACGWVFVFCRLWMRESGHY